MNTYFKNGIEYESIGGIEIPLPPRPSRTKIANYNFHKKDQKFKRTPLPDSFKKLDISPDGEIKYTAEQKEFIDQEQDRILDGYWLFINGVETYITGYHYAELNYWPIDVGLKEYRDRDRRVHLHWDYCEKDPLCLGQIYMKHRRDGATYRACCVNFFRTIKFYNAHSGIQSKTGPDAKAVFTKLVSSWRKVPAFLQPIHEGTDFPKADLRFFEPATKMSKNNRRVKQSQALESWIDYKPAIAEAYDGQKLRFFHFDEAGKCTEMKVSETWRIARRCLMQGANIVGKCMMTTTVAEMERKGGAEFKKIWDQSDPTKRDLNGRTVSGLYKLFITAYDGLEGFIGEFGESIIENATPEQKAFLKKNNPHINYDICQGSKDYLLFERQGLKDAGDTSGVAEHKRQFPFTEDEALRPDGSKCLFDSEKIIDRIEFLSFNPNIVQRGDFVWEKGIRDSRVIFQHNSTGKYQVAWLPDKPEDTNKVRVVRTRVDLDESRNTYTRNIYRPENKVSFCIGIDPFDHNQVSSGSGSKAAAYVFWKYETLHSGNPWNNNFIVQYLGRPKKAAMFYEDMIKLCVFFGCECLPENNKPGIVHYFESRGYSDFIMTKPAVLENKREQISKPDITPGAPATEKSKQEIVERIEEFVFDGCKSPFVEQLEDWLSFDIAETEKYDSSMASGWTLIASRRFVKAKADPIKATTIIQYYDNSGTVSVPIYNN